ncbi:MAG: biotin--[acetyl-CoA-carboxylase] ligase [Planctomycetes bacterium]|nr:biotin--[acetyl-CoA-carboxylase] ligase [Planctomycetota bacterium]
MNTSWGSSARRAWSGRTTRFEETDSTNERALAAVASGDARHGDVFVARAQTRGRGRRGAAWHSPAGEGLYFSVVLLPGAPALPAALTMASGVAVWRALRELGLASVELRWPNDLFVGRAKLVGILVETRGLDPAAPHYVVGIGINVAQRAFAPELVAERAVTSLALEGVATTVDAVLERVVAELEPALELALFDPEATARDYAEAARLLGACVRVEVPASMSPNAAARRLAASAATPVAATPVAATAVAATLVAATASAATALAPSASSATAPEATTSDGAARDAAAPCAGARFAEAERGASGGATAEDAGARSAADAGAGAGVGAGARVAAELPPAIQAGDSGETAGVLVGRVRAFGAARGVEVVLDSGEVRRLALEHIRGLARL